MVRTANEEDIVCQVLRAKYFENPCYRKWSDIVPHQAGSYGGRIEYSFLIDYITGEDGSIMDPTKFYNLLDNGHNLPIDWSALYSYFDERFKDEDNYALDELTKPFLSSNTPEPIRWSVMDILNHYRESLLSHEYDMV